jgi:hypothetical protein
LTDLIPIVLYILSTLESLNMLLHTYNDTYETDTTTIETTAQFCRFDPELPVPHYDILILFFIIIFYIKSIHKAHEGTQAYIDYKQ